MNHREIVITSGSPYIDIDAYACGFAYHKLLQLIGKPSRLVFEGPPNESVSETVRSWGVSYETKLDGNGSDYCYVLVDISDPDYHASFVIVDNVIEVFDHHFGFETYWHERIGDGARIENVGSCAALIWEEYKKHNLTDKIESVSANLLYTAILSNTLNFKAQVTTPRDIEAANELMLYTSFPNNWREQYFQEVTKSVMDDPINALANDTKETSIKGLTYRIGQIELWDAKEFVKSHRQVLLDRMTQSPIKQCFITVASIVEGCNYIVCLDEGTKVNLKAAIGVTFDGNLGKTSGLWLRKELMREIATVSNA